MSRRNNVLIVIAVVVLAAMAAIVYSRQSGNAPIEQRNEFAASQQPAKPSATVDANATPSPKAICTLPASQAPGIGGARLGMKVPEVLALFPGSKEVPEVKMDLDRPPTALGESRFIVRPEAYSTKDSYPGVSRITFTALDGKIVDIYAGYNGPEWKNVDEFINKFSEESKLLAADAWEPYPGLNQLKLLKCDGFEVRVNAGGKGGKLNYIRVRDLAAERLLNDRRAKAVQKAEKEAKP